MLEYYQAQTPLFFHSFYDLRRIVQNPNIQGGHMVESTKIGGPSKRDNFTREIVIGRKFLNGYVTHRSKPVTKTR